MKEIFSIMHPAELILAILLVLTLFNLIFFWDKMRNALVKHLTLSLILTYFCGVILYTIGFYFDASANIFTSSLRAAVASLEMFVAHSSLIEVSEDLQENSTLYMVCFAFVHFMAIVLAFIVIMEAFGKRLLSIIEMQLLVIRPTGKNLYIFDGLDESSVSLAETLPESKEGRTILFIKGAIDTDVKDFSLLEVLTSGFRSRNTEIKLKDTRIIQTAMPLSYAMTNKSGLLYKDIIGLITKYSSVEFFLLSDDAQKNADTAYELSQEMKENNVKGKIFAGIDSKGPYSFKLASEDMVIPVNRSELRITHMLDTTPILGDGIGRQTLIIGFGNTGQECLRRLNEAGFENIDVVDRVMNNISEYYLCMNPQIKDHSGYHFHNFDTNSNEYWSFIRENIHRFYNIIVFNKDDAQAYSTGIRILEYAINIGKDLESFRIYVAGRKPSSQIYIKSTEDKYGIPRNIIYTFGDNNSIYDYKRISKTENYVMPTFTAGIDSAIRLAEAKFHGKKDLDGNPAVLHLIAVGMAGKTEDEKIVGFLHDVVEDTRVDFEELRRIGFSESVLEALRLCTHEKGITYDEYVERILKSGNTTALNVKINDLKHNLARGLETQKRAEAEGDSALLANIKRINAKHEKALAMFQDQVS